MSVLSTLVERYGNMGLKGIRVGFAWRLDPPAHDRLAFARAAAHVVALALPSLDSALALLQLLKPRALPGGAFGFCSRLSGGELLLRLDEGVGLGLVLLALFDRRRCR
jgi:hypothetical protein